MLPHAGTDTKIWREVVALGTELRGLAALEGEPVHADVVILLDHASIWAQDHPAQPTDALDPVAVIKEWHAALTRAGITCDLARPDQDLSAYRLVLVPSLYLVDDAGARNLEGFVRDGGTALVAPYSGIVDENDRVRLGGYPGAWRELLGITVEEFFPIGEPVPLASGGTGRIWCETAHAVTAEVLDTYADGRPAWTRNAYGDGAAHYLTTLPADPAAVLAAVCAEAGAVPAAPVPPGVEAVRRGGHLFLINHSDADAVVEGIKIPAGDVRVDPPLTREGQA
jgi:beta-galactosidase